MPGMNETTTQGRMPMRGESAKALTSGGTKMKQPMMPSMSGQHVPARGMGATAMQGTPVNGLEKMMANSTTSRDAAYRQPVRSAEMMMPAGKSAQKGA